MITQIATLHFSDTPKRQENSGWLLSVASCRAGVRGIIYLKHLMFPWGVSFGGNGKVFVAKLDGKRPSR